MNGATNTSIIGLSTYANERLGRATFSSSSRCDIDFRTTMSNTIPDETEIAINIPNSKAPSSYRVLDDKIMKLESLSLKDDTEKV